MFVRAQQTSKAQTCPYAFKNVEVHTNTSGGVTNNKQTRSGFTTHVVDVHLPFRLFWLAFVVTLGYPLRSAPNTFSQQKAAFRCFSSSVTALCPA